MIVAIAFLFGLLIGSFLNVCISRLPEDLSVITPRSHCPACGKLIAWYDNVPLLSFVLLRGRCRHCGIPIPWRYPLVELVTGLLFALAFWRADELAPAIKLCLFSAILVDLIVTDWETRILPDEFTKGGIVLGLAMAYWVPFPEPFSYLLLPTNSPAPAYSIGDALLGGGIAAGMLWLCGAVYLRVRGREGLGFGDVKLVALLGVFLGLQGVILTILFGSLLGLSAGGVQLIRGRTGIMTYEFPYGSFLGLAGLAVAFWQA